MTDATKPDALVSRQAPYSAEAEQAVLCSMMTNPDAGLRGAEMLDDWMFYREAHRRLYRVMVGIVRRQELVDPVTLKAELEAKGELENVGGIDYLTYLLDVTPTAANFDHHARLVRDKALLRRLIEAGTAIVQEAYEGRRRADEIVEGAEQKLFEVAAHHRVGPGFKRVSKLVLAALDEIEAMHGVGRLVTGVPSGFTDLDERTAGFQPADLVIVAARPSMGKTAFCLNVAQHVAIEHGTRVAVFSLEMQDRALVKRMLSSEARVDGHRMRTGTMRDSDYKLMSSAAGLIAKAPIWIDDSGALTPLEVRAKARRLAGEEKGLGLVIVDYLQLMREPEYKDNRNQEISAISRALKGLAKELNIPVIALSQLSRALETRSGKNGKRPQLSDLRESGALEQDADTVLFLYRPELYAKTEEQRDELRGQAEVIIGKQRNGPTGIVKLYFHEQYTRFDNYSAHGEAWANEGRGEQQAIELAPVPAPKLDTRSSVRVVRDDWRDEM